MFVSGARHLSKIGNTFEGLGQTLKLDKQPAPEALHYGAFLFPQNEHSFGFLSAFFCYHLFMRYKTYEADKDGRIYIYPSPDVSGRKMPDILKIFIKKLIDVARGKGKKSPQAE